MTRAAAGSLARLGSSTRLSKAVSIQTLAYLSCCLFLLAGAQAPPTASHRENARPAAPVISVSTVVVNVYALVEDGKGHLLSNLGKDDFTVTEDDVPQQVQYFSRETDAPLTLGIVVDTSPSQGNVLAIEKAEAKTLLQRAVGPNDLAFLLGFDVDVELLQSLTCNQPLLARAVDGTAIHVPSDAALAKMQTDPKAGGSHLYDAIFLASNLLMKKQVGRKVLVLLTDGEDSGSVVTLEAALEAAERADVIIYSVPISDRAFYLNRGMRFHGDSTLKKFSTATGGRMSRGRDADSTSAAFRRITGELRGQYLLGYASDKPRDGSFRKLSVHVRNSTGRIRARRGYYADPQ